MTLIACTLNYNKPFLVGDLLVTSPDAEQSIQLPTNSNDLNEYLDADKARAVGLYQKIYIINDNVCVALAGDVYEMTEFLKEFIQRCSYFGVVTEENIHEFIRGYDKENLFSNSAFFIMLMVNDGPQIAVRQFWYPIERWASAQSDIFQEAYACGSGKEDFLYQVAEKQHNTEASSEKGDIHRAVAFNLGIIARLLATERISLHTINNYWGGGFETICFDGNKFIKLDQMAYVTNYAKFDNEGNIGLPFPQLIIYYEYYQECLFMSSIEIKEWNIEETEESFRLTSSNYKADMHIAPRIDLPKGSKIELPLVFSFYTERISFGYTFITGNGFLAPAYFSESKDTCIHYEDEKFIRLTMNKQVNEKICALAKEVFPNL